MSLLLCLCYVFRALKIQVKIQEKCQVRVTVGGSDLCCCVCVAYFER